jgi:hypothetical protein
MKRTAAASARSCNINLRFSLNSAEQVLFEREDHYDMEVQIAAESPLNTDN